MIKHLNKVMGLAAVVGLLAACQHTDNYSDMRTVYFDFGSAKLNRAGTSVVGETADILIKHHGRFKQVRNDVRIVTPAMAYLSGHTDSVGNASTNQRLSERRVMSVKDELINDGVSRNRISVSAHGENMQKVNTGDGVKEGRNRRVEIKIVK